eukprot:gene25811-31582_t
MNVAAGGGLDWIKGIDGFFVQQKVEMLETVTGCDTKNRYALTQIQQGLPDPIPRLWINNLKKTAAQNPLIKAKEESFCLTRICFPSIRSLIMPFKDTKETTFMTVMRPFKCTCFWPGICMLNPQELSVIDAQGNIVGLAEEEFRQWWFCTRTINAKNGQGELQYRLRVPQCGTSSGSNCCAPSCFNYNFVIDLYNPEETEVLARSASVWPGCNCGGLTDRSNLVVRFPPDASLEQRSSVIAAMWLAEFAIFEASRSSRN